MFTPFPVSTDEDLRNALLERPFSRQAGKIEVDKLPLELLVQVGELSVSPGTQVSSRHIDIVHLQA